MSGWRWVMLCLGVLSVLRAHAADEDYQHLVDDYVRLVQQAEASNTPEMLLAPNAIRIIDELTDRRRLQGYANNPEDLEKLLERGRVAVQLMSRLNGYKPARYSVPSKPVNSLQFRGPIAKLYTHALLAGAKSKEMLFAQSASSGVMIPPTEVRALNADSRSLFIEALYMVVPPYDPTDQYRLAEALLISSPSLLETMPPEKRSAMLPDLEAVYRVADVSVRPLLDKLRQQLQRQDCVKFCALLQQGHG